MCASFRFYAVNNHFIPLSSVQSPRTKDLQSDKCVYLHRFLRVVLLVEVLLRWFGCGGKDVGASLCYVKPHYVRSNVTNSYH